MIRVFEQATEYIRRGEPCALVTVVQTSGSVPRHAGAKMLVNAHGAIVAGTIGGGEMESRASQLAQQAIADGKSRTATYHLADLQRGDPGVCGGTVEVFIEPLLPASTLLVVGAGHVGRALVRLANRRYRQRATLGSGCPGPARAGGQRIRSTAHTRANRHRNSRRNARGDRRQHHGPDHSGLACGTLA